MQLRTSFFKIVRNRKQYEVKYKSINELQLKEGVISEEKKI